jgi:putative transposase
MARLARVVVPGVPHHVTQRGNQRQETFFGEQEYAAYPSPPGESAFRDGMALGGALTNLAVVPSSCCRGA